MGEGVDGRLEKKMMMCREKRKNKGKRGKEKGEQGVKNGVKCNKNALFWIKKKLRINISRIVDIRIDKNRQLI